MVFKVRMPRIDANVTEGMIGCWLARVGQQVAQGDALVEIITDKAAFELPAEQGGLLRAQAAPEKSVVPVGYVIALLSERDDEPLPDVSGENDEIMRQHADAVLLGSTEPAQHPRGPGHATQQPLTGEQVRATPAARRLARLEGVRLEDVPAAEGGAIQQGDVLRHVRLRNEGEKDSPNGG